MVIPPSELILNPDKSIYHLNLKPGDLASTIITVGDAARIDMITKHFDKILLEKSHREFRTVTGECNGKPLSIIATGIGTDNIDIVINEVDALFNIDFESRMVRAQKTSLNILRIGTSGSVHENIPIDSIIVSKHAIGIDGLMNGYASDEYTNTDLSVQLKSHLETTDFQFYTTDCSMQLFNKLRTVGKEGITITANGFYGPQSRNLRLKSRFSLSTLFKDFGFHGLQISNIEMETAGIYALSSMLGHQAISLNAILANRINKSFSPDPNKIVNRLIELSIEKISNLNS